MGMKKRDLKRVQRDIHQHLCPSWFNNEGRIPGIIREEGPLIQEIEVFSHDGFCYQVAAWIFLLIIPSSKVPSQLCRTGNLGFMRMKDHENEMKFARLLKQMREQMVPSIDHPLEPRKLLERLDRLDEDIAWQITFRYAFAMAVFHAYYGHDEKVLDYTRRFHEFVEQRRQATREPNEHDTKALDFLAEVSGWLKAGTARERLDAIRDEERKRLGSPDAG